MDKKIGLQIAGSDPGFTIFFSADWEGKPLMHSSERKNSVEPVYYEACFGAEYWTYVAVHCNFLSNVNREESFKIGLRLPARHELTDRDGDRVSPATVTGRIFESVKSTALTRRGAETYRLKPDAEFDAASYAAILEDYILRPVWGVTAESQENGPDVFMELRGVDPSEFLMHVPYTSTASMGAKVCIGSFTDDIDKYLFSHKAEPFVKVNVTGKDRVYEYVIAPGQKLLIRTSDCGYSEEQYEEESILLDCDTIVATCGEEIGSDPGPGVSYYANAEGGVVFVKFLPKAKPSAYEEKQSCPVLTVRIPDDKKTVRPLRIRLENADGSVRQIVYPALTFAKDGSDMSATVEIAGLEPDDNIVVSLDSPATAECIAFGDDKGVFVADFVRHGRRRNLCERFVEAMGIGAGNVSGTWLIVRWLVIAVLAGLLIFGGMVLAKFTASVVDGAHPFIDKIK